MRQVLRLVLSLLMLLKRNTLKLIKKILSNYHRIFPLAIAGIWVWSEWQKSYNPTSPIAHWAHIGGALGAAFYIFKMESPEKQL